MKFQHFFLTMIVFFSTSFIYSLEKPSGFDLYEPGIFNPLGPTLLYGNSDIQRRPYMLMALNEKNEIVEKSLLQYNKDGRLIAEKIFDAKNQFKGEVLYKYDDKGNVIEETYKDFNGNIIAKKVRHFRNNVLDQIDVYDANELVFSRKYKYEKNQIIGRENQKGISEPFVIKLKNGLIESVEFKEKNTTLMEIKYKYQQDKLVERIKTTGDAQSKCEYIYDNNNRLKEYIFSDFIRSKWIKTKTIQFVYADQI